MRIATGWGGDSVNPDYLMPSKEANTSTGNPLFDGSFRKAFLHQGVFNTWTYADCRTTWLGINVRQAPQDIMIFQQLLYMLRPQLFIETGTFRGGFAYFIATIFHLMGEKDARVLTIGENTIEQEEMSRCGPGRTPSKTRPRGALFHDSIWKQHVRPIVASSISALAMQVVKKELLWLRPDETMIVSLDSDHQGGHVWAEIELYAPLVPVGSYLVVQDVILDYVKAPWAGPKSAVDKLLNAPEALRKALGTFVWDKSVEIFGFTGHMYLRRIA